MNTDAHRSREDDASGLGGGLSTLSIGVNLSSSVVLLFVLLIALAFLTGRGFEPSVSASLSIQQDRLKDPKFIGEGARLFAPTCGSGYCHGAGGRGGGAPRLRGKGLEAPYLFKTISNGVPGTPMLAFKSEFSRDQIWKLVAFIMSDAKDLAPGANVSPAPPPSEAPEKRSQTPETASVKPPGQAAAGSIVGTAQAGRALFFDSTQPKSCQSCHSFDGIGASLGPDLSKVGNRPAREIFLSIVLPGEVKDPRYATVTLTLRSGERITGLKTEEDSESVRIYDLTELPAVLRTVQKPDIAKIETTNDSPMPKDYAAVYTMKQLLDIVTFLRSSDHQSKSAITLRDLL